MEKEEEVKIFFRNKTPEQREKWKKQYEKDLSIIDGSYIPGKYPLTHKKHGQRMPYPERALWMYKAWNNGLQILNEVINEQQKPKQMSETVTKQDATLEKLKSQAELKFEGVKKLALELQAQAKAIDIKDELTLGMANQLLSKVKDHEKAVDEKRKALKKPYYDAGVIIDATAKAILAPLQDAMETGKTKLRIWNEQQQAIINQANAELEKKKEFLEKIINQIKEKCDKCVTPAQCISLSASIEKLFPTKDKFGPYGEQAMIQKKLYIDLLKTKHDAIAAALSGEQGSTDAIATMKDAEADVAATSNEVIQQAEEKKQELQEVAKGSVVKGSVRRVWKAVVVDHDKLPRRWLMPNMDAINKYMADNKINMMSPAEVDGVKFYIDEVPLIK